MSPGARALSAAVALAALAAIATGLMSGPRREAPRRPLASASATRPEPRRAPPDARAILAQSAALDLSATQRRRLEALDSQWRLRERGLLDALEGAQRDMPGLSGGGRPVALRELQQRAAGFSELSMELREARAGHVEDALSVLTPTQALRLREMSTTTMSRGGPNEARTN